MSESLNATCAVCGERYHICNACKSVKTYKPWRTITDSAQCYKLYLIVHDYNNGMICLLYTSLVFMVVK